MFQTIRRVNKLHNNSYGIIQAVNLFRENNLKRFFSTNDTNQKKKKKVIVDTDAGWDDVLSIAYLLKNPDIDLLGITTTGAGETHPEGAKQVAQYLFNIANHEQGKIALGAEKPSQFNNQFPEAFRYQNDNIMGILQDKTKTFDIDERKAWHFIEDTLAESDEPVTILCIGGFTNLARYLDIATTQNKIEMIYAMAGALEEPGNVAELNAAGDFDQGLHYRNNLTAEFNVFIDPVAASKVFKSDLPLTIVPLDACRPIQLQPEYVDEIKANDPLAKLVKAVLEKKSGKYREKTPKNVPMFDPVATVLLSGNLKSKEYVIKDEFNVVVHALNDVNAGNTYYEEKGERQVSYCMKVDEAAFIKEFFDVINEENH